MMKCRQGIGIRNIHTALFFDFDNLRLYGKKSIYYIGSKVVSLHLLMTLRDFSREKGSLYGRLEVRASKTSAMAARRPASGISFPFQTVWIAASVPFFMVRKCNGSPKSDKFRV